MPNLPVSGASHARQSDTDIEKCLDFLPRGFGTWRLRCFWDRLDHSLSNLALVCVGLTGWLAVFAGESVLEVFRGTVYSFDQKRPDLIYAFDPRSVSRPVGQDPFMGASRLGCGSTSNAASAMHVHPPMGPAFVVRQLTEVSHGPFGLKNTESIYLLVVVVFRNIPETARRREDRP